jgi:hypothetical protein
MKRRPHSTPMAFDPSKGFLLRRADRITVPAEILLPAIFRIKVSSARPEAARRITHRESGFRCFYRSQLTADYP